jgi:transcriptional regulator with XRE-family HTH domain
MSRDDVITPEQIRAARALLEWSARETADRSGVSLPTIQRAEKRSSGYATQPRTLADLKRAFEDAGVEFIGTPEEPGVILRRKA